MLPGAGDELQGIKKGLLERADIIAVNKADGPALHAARQAAADLLSAVKILAPEAPPAVLTLSAETGDGLAELWSAVAEHGAQLKANGRLAERRRSQGVIWMHDMISEGLRAHLHAHAGSALAEAEGAVHAGRLAPSAAARDILSRLPGRRDDGS